MSIAEPARSSVTSVPRRPGRGDENNVGHDTPGERRIGCVRRRYLRWAVQRH